MKINIILSFLFLLSCVDIEKKNELVRREKEILIKERDLQFKEDSIYNSTKYNSRDTVEPISNTFESTEKYSYVAFLVEQPMLGIYNFLVFKKYTFQTDIVKVNVNDEDQQYRLADQMEMKIREELNQHDKSFHSEVFYNVKDNDLRNAYDGVTSRILKRKILIFNSYKEASIARSLNNEIFE